MAEEWPEVGKNSRAVAYFGHEDRVLITTARVRNGWLMSYEVRGAMGSFFTPEPAASHVLLLREILRWLDACKTHFELGAASDQRPLIDESAFIPKQLNRL